MNLPPPNILPPDKSGVAGRGDYTIIARQLQLKLVTVRFLADTILFVIHKMESEVILRTVGFVKIDNFKLLEYHRVSKEKLSVIYEFNNMYQGELVFEFPNENVNIVQLHVYSWHDTDCCYKTTCVASYDLMLNNSKSICSNLERTENQPVLVDITKYLSPVVIRND